MKGKTGDEMRLRHIMNSISLTEKISAGKTKDDIYLNEMIALLKKGNLRSQVKLLLTIPRKLCLRKMMCHGQTQYRPGVVLLTDILPGI